MTADDIRGVSAREFAVALDVTSEDEWAAALARITNASGHLDVLVNSAGLSFAAPVADMTLADWRRVLAVNLDGVFLGTKHAIRAMTPRGGAIVNVDDRADFPAARERARFERSRIRRTRAHLWREVRRTVRDRTCDRVPRLRYCRDDHWS